MTRVILIHAGPTPWDADNRVTGAHSLPLTTDGVAAIKLLAESLDPPPTALYLDHQNEACLEAGNLLVEKFEIRLRDDERLGEFRLGLWEGLTREELRRRFPSVVPQWQENPLSVYPPEGESLGEAIERVRPALTKILQKQRGGVVCLVLRPLMLQIVAGLLRTESPEAIAHHLNNVDVMETMELNDE